MNQPVVRSLVLKDLYLARPLIIGSFVAGLLSLAVAPWSRTALLIGGVSYMVVMIILNTMIVNLIVVGERKERMSQFVLSLPLSTRQYFVAKVLASVIGFAVPGLLLTLAMVAVIDATPLPNGFIPFTIAMSVHFLCYFAIFLGVALVTESPRWITSVLIGGNVSITFVFQLFIQLPSVRGNLGGPGAVWGPDILAAIAIELVLATAALGISAWVHSRKTEFI